jgi:hypothetical protein
MSLPVVHPKIASRVGLLSLHTRQKNSRKTADCPMEHMCASYSSAGIRNQGLSPVSTMV